MCEKTQGDFVAKNLLDLFGGIGFRQCLECCFPIGHGSSKLIIFEDKLLMALPKNKSLANFCSVVHHVKDEHFVLSFHAIHPSGYSIHAIKSHESKSVDDIRKVFADFTQLDIGLD